MRLGSRGVFAPQQIVVIVPVSVTLISPATHVSLATPVAPRALRLLQMYSPALPVTTVDPLHLEAGLPAAPPPVLFHRPVARVETLAAAFLS